MWSPMASLFCVRKVNIHKFWNAINSSIFERRTFALGAISDKYKPGRKIAQWTLRLPSVFWYYKWIFDFVLSLKQSPVCFKPKGRCQKRFSGFFPLRGGVPPFPLSFFVHNYCPLRKIPLKSRYFRFENSIFCLFSCIFSPFWSIIWPFR